jgi:hypothetical protein
MFSSNKAAELTDNKVGNQLHLLRPPFGIYQHVYHTNPKTSVHPSLTPVVPLSIQAFEEGLHSYWVGIQLPLILLQLGVYGRPGECNIVLALDVL